MEYKKTVVCGANAYEQKYYFNEEFDRIPESIKEELRIISILFTQDAGGIFTIAFNEEGELVMETQSEEDDITYDDIAAGMLVARIRQTRAELLESLEMYYKVFIAMDPEAIREFTEE